MDLWTYDRAPRLAALVRRADRRERELRALAGELTVLGDRAAAAALGPARRALARRAYRLRRAARAAAVPVVPLP